VLSEGPSRVRVLLESGELREMVQRIKEEKQLGYGAMLSFLVAVCSNESAA
jgi:hypothetical protein